VSINWVSINWVSINWVSINRVLINGLSIIRGGAQFHPWGPGVKLRMALWARRGYQNGENIPNDHNDHKLHIPNGHK
jgi:hypothetical protein